MKKRFLALLLTFVMCLSMTAPAYAAETIFDDVNADDWYADEIKWVYDEGLMDGVGNDNFAPERSTSRAMIVTVLWRLEGKPEATGTNPFTDVPADTWYTDAVLWGTENEIVKGYGDTFRPDETATREHLVTFLYRYAQYKGYDVSVGETTDLSGYTDAASVSDWALPAMKWAVGAGLINGVTTTTLGSKQPAIRGQFAAILYRLNENVIEQQPEEEPSVSPTVAPTTAPITPPAPPVVIPTPTPVPHEHNYEYTSNYDGTHNGTCACDEEPITNQDCSFPESGNICELCGYDKTVLYIHTVDELKAFRDDVNAGNNYSGKTVKLTADIDLNNEAWTPIGTSSKTFKGIFDGGNNTISNLKIDAPTAWYQGLFGYIATNATIKNVTVDNASVTALCMSGVIVGNVQKEGTITNCHVTGDIVVVGGYYMGGIAGDGGYANFSNCSVIGNDGSSITANDEDGKSFVGGIVGYRGEGDRKIENCVVKNLDITGYEVVGAIAGMAQYDNTITGCTVEDVTLTQTREGADPYIGLASGCWTAKANDADYMTTITNNSFKNVVIGGVSTAMDNYLYGGNYHGSDAEITLTDSGNTYEGIEQVLTQD